MTIGKYARGAATALVLGLAILGLSTGQAEAAKNKHPKDNGVRCMMYGGGDGEDMNFFMPGEVVTNGDGKKNRCGKDGDWYPARASDDASDEVEVGGGGVYAP